MGQLDDFKAFKVENPGVDHNSFLTDGSISLSVIEKNGSPSGDWGVRNLNPGGSHERDPDLCDPHDSIEADRYPLE